MANQRASAVNLLAQLSSVTTGPASAKVLVPSHAHDAGTAVMQAVLSDMLGDARAATSQAAPQFATAPLRVPQLRQFAEVLLISRRISFAFDRAAKCSELHCLNG